MEKLTVMSNFVKSVESLRNNESSQKEKVQHFRHIAECLVSPSMISNEHYGKHFSSGISVLLFFCEDLDSVVRMRAEENLNRIIRSAENTRLSRVLLDLYNEIKKNGNQKSLRICLNIFAYYCPRMKEKTVKWYALKLLPCLQAIAKRKEPQLHETLSEFVKCFSKHLQMCLNDNETIKLLEIFFADIVSDCAVKRRCSAQSCVYLIQGSRNADAVAKQALNKALDYLQRGDLSTATIIGVLGLLRLLLPITVSNSKCDHKQTIEIYDLCLHLLNNCNHSIINASLEVINAILSSLSPDLKETLIGNDIHQHDFLKKRKSLKNQIFQLKNAEMTCSASPSVSSTIVSSSMIADRDKGGGGDGDGLVLNQQQVHALGKSSTETIKDAFKSASGNGDGPDEQFTSEARRQQETTNNAGQDSISSSSTNEIRINDESTTSGVSSSKFCKVTLGIVDGAMGDSLLSSANANRMTASVPTSITIVPVPQINEPHEDEEGHLHWNEDKSQILSDVDNESFNSIDFESEITIGIGNDGIDYELKEAKDNRAGMEKKSRAKDKEKDDEKADTKSTKSTDSIGAFFNNLLSHSNTETMTKLFRPSTKLSTTTTTDRTPASPSSSSLPSSLSASRVKPKQTSDTEGMDFKFQPTMKYTTATTTMSKNLVACGDVGGSGANAGIATLTFEDDTISLESINSHISLSSHVSQHSRNGQDLILAPGNDSEIERKSDRTVWYEVVESSWVDPQREPHKPLKQKRANEISRSAASTKDESHNELLKSPRKGDISDVGSVNAFDDDAATVQMNIGRIYEQNIIHYTVRLIASRFLLSGTPGGLITDTEVRVSIKNLSLTVVANCVDLKPDVLLVPLEFDRAEIVSVDMSPDTSNENSSGSFSTQDLFLGLPADDITDDKRFHEVPIEEALLEIKDDHFGECTYPFLFDSPLSKSAEQALLAPLKSIADENKIRDDTRSKLNQQLEQILSKSEIIESQSYARQSTKLHPLAQPRLQIQSTKSANIGNVVPLNKPPLRVESNAKRNVKKDAKEPKQSRSMDYEKLEGNKMRPFATKDTTDRVNPTAASSSTIAMATIELHHHHGSHRRPEELQYNRGDGEEHQFIRDIFLYCNHTDPVLRGNMQIIACNFAKACLTDSSGSGLNKQVNMTMQTEREDNMGLSINTMLSILIKGFQDEIHTVIIQALTFFDKIYSLAMTNYYAEQKSIQLCQRKPENEGQHDLNDAGTTSTEMLFDENPELAVQEASRITPKLLLNQLQLCFANRYWLVQNKYASVISNFNFDAIREYYDDDDIAVTYEDIFLQQLLQLLGDDDARVRDHVAVCLCDYIQPKVIPTMAQMKGSHEFDRHLLEEFYMQRVFRGMSKSLCEVLKVGRSISINGSSLLSRVLFLLTNKIMDLDKKNMQIGVINAIRIVLEEFKPVDDIEIWNEFNLLDICLCFMLHNFSTALDIHTQISLIEINTKLLSANLLTGRNVQSSQLIDNLFDHVMKILSIYYYLFTNQKPPMLSVKSQRTDLLFPNIKDSAAHHGDEQNSDYIYVKLYDVLKTTHDNFKITINQESGNKLMSLLASCLSTLSTLLEFKPTISAPNSSVKLIEEILQYLTVIVNYSPIETINCLRQLLKFLFCRNYGNRKVEYENFLKLYFTVRNCGRDDGRRTSPSLPDALVDGVTTSTVPGATGVESGNRSSPLKYQLERPDESGKGETNAEKDLVGNGDRFNLSELFASAISFPLGKSKLEEDSARHIKLFEPLVIYCLTLFMKSNAVVQSSILDMLSELLEYNITYSILDSKNIIFDQVENNIEMIENGTARNSSLLIRSIIRFLIKLTKQCDRKLISMPKVISIVNNLFTNKALRDSSVIALKEVAYELFFKRPKRINYSAERSLKIKELNAEREVILRMLEQYINSIECQKMLATLLLWAQTGQNKNMSADDSSIDCVHVMEAETATDPTSSPTSPGVDSVQQQLQTTIVQERAILSIVIGALENETIAVNNCETYFVLDAIFRNCDKSILLTNDLFESLLALFIGKHVGNFNNLSHAVIILDNVILKTEQIYLSNHVKLLFMKNAIDADPNKNVPVVESKDELNTTNLEHGSEQEHHTKMLARRRMESHAEWECGGGTPSSTVDDEINYFVKVLYAMLETCFSTSIARSHDTDYSYLTSKYIRSVVKASMKFEKIRCSLRTLFTYNNTIYEKLEISSPNHEQVQVDILILLCELCLGRDEGDGSSSFASSSDYSTFGRTLQPRSILQYTQKIKKTNGQQAILNRVCEKFNHINWWMKEDIKVLLSEELLQAFLQIETNLRRELAQHPTYSRVLMEQLLLLPTVYYKTILPSILGLISKVNLNASILKLKFLWRLFNGESANSSSLNRSLEKLIQLHFNNEVQSLKSRLQRGDCKEYCSRNNDAIDILKEISTSDNGRHLNKLSLSTQNTLERLLRLFTNGGLLKDDDVTSSGECYYERLDDRKVGEFQEEINEKWLMQQVVNISSQSDPKALAKVLMDFKSEIKLKTIFNADKFCPKDILGPCLDISFHAMITSFRNNCVQYNPHINYMNVNPLLRVTLQIYLQDLENAIEHHESSNESDLDQLSAPTLALMNNLHKLEHISLLYIKIAAIEKFVRDRLLKSQIPIEKLLIEYATRIAKHAKQHFICRQGSIQPQMQIHIQCLDAILKQKFVWMEINQPQKYEKHLNVILDMLHEGMVNSIPYTIYQKLSGLQCQETKLLCFGATPTKKDSHARGNGGMQANAINDDNKDDGNDGTDSDNQSFRMRKVIFLAKLIEFSMTGKDDKIYAKFIHSRQLMKTLTSIAISLLRTNFHYGLAVVPYELLQTLNYGKELSSYAKLPSIPVDSLSDLDTLQKFIKRLSIFGFSTRQQFEEYFMTFLLLINRVYDVNMVDEQEQFLIKNACLTVIIELLIMCKTFPFVGNRVSQFHHSPRWQRIRCRNDISLKKLHKIQLIIPGTNVFYHPNLERDLSVICHDSIIGTNYFLPNQYELNHVWQQMEPLASEGLNIGSVGVSTTSTPGPGAGNQTSRDVSNSGLCEFDEIKEDTSGIDLKSSCQLIFDVFTQIIEQNHILVLPNLVSFCEICDNREHIRWIKNTVSKLQEQIPFDDTISHHYIIYLLCRTQSILVPSFTELSHLCSIISTYLKSTHIFIRNAALHGLLCLLECCSKTSTTLGKLSEELCLLREIILGYITRHGIIEESPTVFSDTHTKLVWTLNFSLIEMTTKFVPECHLLSNTIISANNLLKRTTNETIYLCIVHGLERIMVVNTPQKPFCDKVEKLALELVKLENERFSLPALKLLLSCVYMGSSKQLETTEHSNGIVQDDPEIIAQQTEKVDVLLHRIKSSTSTAARIYGEVLCQIVRDLVPANEILTKVIKEFLAINQPHCEVIARIVYQVFRSCIDSSFLRMLQDWLICSLPNFLTLPPENGVWCLTIIFLSSSINLDLIKLFPFALNHTKVVDDIKTLLFIISARDFYVKLNAEEKTRFRDIFKDCELDIYIDMLKCL